MILSKQLAKLQRLRAKRAKNKEEVANAKAANVRGFIGPRGRGVVGSWGRGVVGSWGRYIWWSGNYFNAFTNSSKTHVSSRPDHHPKQPNFDITMNPTPGGATQGRDASGGGSGGRGGGGGASGGGGKSGGARKRTRKTSS